MSSDEKKVANNLPLSYGLSLLKQLLPAPTHIFKADNHYLEKFDNGEYDEWNVLKTDYEFRKSLIDTIKSKKITIVTDEKPIVYGGVLCSDDIILVVGPVSITKIDQNFCKLYALKHQANNLTPFVCNAEKLASMLLLVYSSISGEHVFLSDFLNSCFLNNDIIENVNRQIANVFTEQSIKIKTHNPGMFEESIKNAIKRGDVDQLKKSLNSIYSSMRGTLSRNSLRSAKNLAIVDITIATRAAIDVGLPVEEMYTISDAFIMEVEDCKYELDASTLAHACALRCTQMVSKYLSENSSSDSSLIVERACQYIEHHINEKLDVKKMCEKLKVSPSYLSRLFKNEKKMTIGDYSRKRKIDIAKILLTTSDKSISEIYEMLSFNSQSHFGRTFLSETGMTPATYKKKYAIVDRFI